MNIHDCAAARGRAKGYSSVRLVRSGISRVFSVHFRALAGLAMVAAAPPRAPLRRHKASPVRAGCVKTLPSIPEHHNKSFAGAQATAVMFLVTESGEVGFRH